MTLQKTVNSQNLKIPINSSFSNSQRWTADYSTAYVGIDVSQILASDNSISDWFLVGPYTCSSKEDFDSTLGKGHDLLSSHENPVSRVQTFHITLQNEDTLG